MAAEIPLIGNKSHIEVHDLLVRATAWHDWVQIEDKEWFLELFNKGKLKSRKPRKADRVNVREEKVLTDARSTPRHSVIGTIWLNQEGGTKFVVGSCVDLSLTGAQFLFDNDAEVKVGDELRLSLRPSKIASSKKIEIDIKLSCKFIWYNAETFRYGVQFKDVNSQLKAQLQYLITFFV